MFIIEAYASGGKNGRPGGQVNVNTNPNAGGPGRGGRPAGTPANRAPNNTNRDNFLAGAARAGRG